MFNFAVQNDHIHSSITGTLIDPAIIVSIDKHTKDVTFQKIGEYDYLKEVVMPKYDPLKNIYTTVLLALNTMPVHKFQQCILLNHLTNVSLSPLTKQFIEHLFSNNVDGCRNTINDMYQMDNKQDQKEDDKMMLHEQISVTQTQWETAFNAYKSGTYTDKDIAILVQSGLNMFDSSPSGEVADQLLALFNKSRRKEKLKVPEIVKIQQYYRTLERDNYHTEIQATEIYTSVDYV